MITIAVIRASTASRHLIGYADIEVWFELAKKRYIIHIFLQGRGSSKRVSEHIYIWEVGLPGIPLVSTFIYWLTLFYKILRIKPHVIITHYTCLPISVILKLLLNSVLIVDIRSIPIATTSIFNRIRYEVPLKASFKSRLVDGIMVITYGMLLQIIKEYNVFPRVPVCVWPSGFNPRYFNEEVDGTKLRATYGQEKRFILLYHGTIAKERGLDNLIYAIKVLIDRGVKNLSLWILGEGKDKKPLQELTIQLGLQEYIVFLDPVPYHEVAKFIAASDACISPLPHHRWWVFQFPLKVIECLAVGKPVIATDIWCHKQIGGGIIYSSGDSTYELANAIMTYINLPTSQVEKLREEAITVSRKYNWKNHAQVIHEYLKFLLLIRARTRYRGTSYIKLFSLANRSGRWWSHEGYKCKVLCN